MTRTRQSAPSGRDMGKNALVQSVLPRGLHLVESFFIYLFIYLFIY